MTKQGRPKKPKSEQRVQISIRLDPDTLKTLKKHKVNIGKWVDKACWLFIKNEWFK